MKKANELSILCDIPIILLMFSPTGKPSLCKGKRRYVSFSLDCGDLSLIFIFFIYLFGFHNDNHQLA
ncbi:unnamed protein product [Linum tenue]|nr:unnamed protein product [Linum tenue]